MSKSKRSTKKITTSKKQKTKPKQKQKDVAPKQADVKSAIPILHRTTGLLVAMTAVMIVLGLLTAMTGTGFSRSVMPEGTSLIQGELAPFWLWLKNTELIYYGFHRLIGIAVVVTTILATVAAFRGGLPESSRRPIRRVIGILMGAVAIQALIGWLRYQTGATELAGIHGIFAPAVFVLALISAIVVRDATTSETTPGIKTSGRLSHIFAWIAVASFYLLIAVDASLRAVPPDASTEWLLWGGRALFILSILAAVGGLTVSIGELRASRKETSDTTIRRIACTNWTLLVVSAVVPFTVSILWIVTWNWPFWLYDALGLPPLRLTAGGTAQIVALLAQTLIALTGLALTVSYLSERRQRQN